MLLATAETHLNRWDGYALSYIRFSAPEQALGDSLRRQVAGTEAYCQEHGLTLLATVKDEGKSGYHGRHRSLKDLVEQAKTGKLKPGLTIVVEALDRLSREKPRLALSQFLELINAGITIVTLIDKQCYHQDSVDGNVGTIFMSIGMMIGAHAESKNKASRIRDKWEQRRGTVARLAPAWLNIVDAQFKVDSIKGAIIERIFNECINGVGLDRIAANLNRDQVPTFATKKRKLSGWYDVYIRKIITGRAVRGEVQYHKTEGLKRINVGDVRIEYPWVVDEKTWLAANDALVSRRGTGGKHTARMVNLFSGLTYCKCGSRMTVRERNYRKQKPYSYLQCHASKHALCTSKRYWNYAQTEGYLIGLLGDVAHQEADQTAEQSALANEIATQKHKASELEKAYVSISVE